MKERMETIKHIGRKIKKLFALSASSNPNEAAAALEKARELMREYSATIDASELLNLGRAEAKTGSRGNNPPAYETSLIAAVAKAFGCRSAYGATSGEGRHKAHDFIGPEHRVQIASYVAEVLLRKLRRARAAYIKSLRRVRKRHAKICRADGFCSGWASAVRQKLTATQVSPEEEKALDEYERSLGWTDGRPIRRISKNENDWGNGFASGRAVEIQSGVGAFEGKLSLEAPA
jgi:hypothetical protein